MKMNVCISSLSRLIVVASAALLISLTATTAAEARNSKPSRSRAALSNNSPAAGNRKSADRLVTPSSIKSRLSRSLAVKRLPIKSLKAISKKCGCPLPNDGDAAGSWGRCFKGCLADVGVGYYGLVICGASCAAAWTGAGAIVCAVCLGVSVTVVEWCALGCLAYPDGMKGPGILMGKNLKDKFSRHRRAPATNLRV